MHTCLVSPTIPDAVLKIGLTGGIGSGKSLVCRLFAELGVPVIDTDAIAHSIVEPGQPAIEQLTTVFGGEIIDREGRLDRASLREKVFRDEAKLRQLEAILHPQIRRQMQIQLKALRSPYVIVAIPLLFEKGWQDEVDRVLVVDTDESLQLQRTMARDQVSKETVQLIMSTQVSRQQRLDKADEVIVNLGGENELRRQVLQLHQQYQALAAGC